jgi:5-methylcytosine-specific restriction protein A
MQPPRFVPPGTLTAKERRKVYDQRRGKTAERGYDTAWKRLRIEYLAMHVFCECDDHKGKDLRALSEVVDHIVPIADNPDSRLDWANLRAMTKRCHDKHTAATRGWGRSRGET